MKVLIGLIVFIALLLLAFSGTIMSQVEQPSYTVIESDGKIEIREYSQQIVAEVKIPGDRKEAIKKGFHLLSDYIFGDNLTSEKIAMTAPVSQQMRGDQWRIRFMMPANTIPRK